MTGRFVLLRRLIYQQLIGYGNVISGPLPNPVYRTDNCVFVKKLKGIVIHRSTFAYADFLIRHNYRVWSRCAVYVRHRLSP